MSRESLRRYWRGPLLSGVGIAAVLWLAATGRLSWYVHPRYALFTVAMCALAAVAVIAVAPVLVRASREARQDATQDPDSPASGASRLGTALTVLLLVGAAAALLVAPPATLSSDLAQQRQLGSGTAGAGGAAASAGAASGSAATVKDWAMQLRQGGGAAVEGRRASMLGFVLPDPAGSPDVFLVARFAISCCAVDAQPIGVPVHSPGWSASLEEGAWVAVDGAFIANPDAASPHQTVLRPANVVEAQQPEDPYVY